MLSSADDLLYDDPIDNFSKYNQNDFESINS